MSPEEIAPVFATMVTKYSVSVVCSQSVVLPLPSGGGGGGERGSGERHSDSYAHSRASAAGRRALAVLGAPQWAARVFEALVRPAAPPERGQVQLQSHCCSAHGNSSPPLLD